MGAGSTRNKPCWCGSGKKLKNCHLDRENMEPPNIHDLQNRTSKMFKTKYCIHPEASETNCKGGIIKAHTIQRSGGLSKIAKEGHVLSFYNSASRNDGLTYPSRIGINKASTFTGFCNFHDTTTFSPIENNPFQFSRASDLTGYVLRIKGDKVRPAAGRQNLCADRGCLGRRHPAGSERADQALAGAAG